MASAENRMQGAASWFEYIFSFLGNTDGTRLGQIGTAATWAKPIPETEKGGGVIFPPKSTCKQ